MILRVLKIPGAMVRARRMMYEVVAQSVLLYISKSWLVTGAMLNVMGGFHHRLSRRIMGMMDKHVEDG